MSFPRCATLAAEDLTQETFIRLLRDLRKGQMIENVKAWLFRVAHNLVIDFSRRSAGPQPQRRRTRPRLGLAMQAAQDAGAA